MNKANFSIIYTGPNYVLKPEMPDGYLRVGSQELPFKRNKPVTVPRAVAVELCRRDDGKEWKCANAEDQREIAAEIAKQISEEPKAPMSGKEKKELLNAAIQTIATAAGGEFEQVKKALIKQASELGIPFEELVKTQLETAKNLNQAESAE